VEAVVGTMVDSVTSVENDKLIEDEFLTYSAGLEMRGVAAAGGLWYTSPRYE
jgi:hypothetical protein